MGCSNIERKEKREAAERERERERDREMRRKEKEKETESWKWRRSDLADGGSKRGFYTVLANYFWYNEKKEELTVSYQKRH